MNIDNRYALSVFVGFAALLSAGQCNATSLQCQHFISHTYKVEREKMGQPVHDGCTVGANRQEAFAGVCRGKLMEAILPPLPTDPKVYDRRISEADAKTACEYARLPSQP